MTDTETNGRVSLREYVDALFAERQSRITAEFAARDLALDLRAEALETRLEHLNALRQTVLEDRVHFVAREKYDIEVGHLQKKLDRAEGALAVARFIGAGGLITALAALARAAEVVR